jgi:NADPH:quinone reductase-like Zn-dependent oxidoreductase
MAQRTVVSRKLCIPIPQEIDDVTAAAALINPGLSAWLTLSQRAKLVRGEIVLVLGATGVTGKLAVQIAKLLGAGRVIAAGRNEQVLSTLHEFRVDATIRIDKPGQDLRESFACEAGGFWLPRHHRLLVGSPVRGSACRHDPQGIGLP